MTLQQRSRRFGGAVILCALLLRLYATGAANAVAAWLLQPNIAAFLTYVETGRNVRFSASPEVFQPHEAESVAPWVPPAVLPVFSAEEAAATKMYYTCSLRPDLEALLQKPLQWYLPLQEPTVLILHSHATESYTRGNHDYTETSAYRTLDDNYNMLSIGAYLAELLARYGITAIQDRTLHDYPDYNGAYGSARKAIQEYLTQYPTIQLVLDLHRDASEGPGGQLRTLAHVDGTDSAQLMLVMGTNAGGLSHSAWEQNLSLALKLQSQLERQAPGITRPISLRSQRFNQDLSPGALLVEVGAAGNAYEEVLPAVEQLAAAIAALSQGTQ